MQLTILNSFYLSLHITNDKTIIDQLYFLKYFSNEQISIINIIRLKLQVIFLCDLIEVGLNCIKEYYTKGRLDRFSKSTCMWPEAKTDKKAVKL